MKTIRKLLSSGRLREILEGTSGISGQVIQVMSTDGQIFARTNFEGRCRLKLDEEGGATGRLLVPTRCIEERCPCFRDQFFSTINAYSNNVGLVIGCHEEKKSKNREQVEFLSRVLSEIVTREEEIVAISSDVLAKYEELSILYEVSRSISSSFSEIEVCSLLLNMAAQGLNVSLGAIFLRDQRAREYVCGATLSLDQLVRESQKLSTEAAELLDDLLADERPLVDTTGAGTLFLSEDATTSLLVPLIHHSEQGRVGRVLGAVILSDKREGEFTAQDQHFMNSLCGQAALGIVNCRSVARLRESERYSRDMELAQSIQEAFFPEKPPKGKGFELFGQCLPARRVGGDYFDYFKGADGRIVIVVADVSGHHVGSAILMASIRSVLRASLQGGATPVEVLSVANRTMFEDMSRACSFVSVFVAAYDPRSRVLQFASAGHNPPLLLLPRENDGDELDVIELDADGLLIGVLPEFGFLQREVQLSPGALVLFYTDGAIEACNTKGEQYGMGRLIQLLRKERKTGPAEVCQKIQEAVENFAGFEHQDDLTLVVLEVTDEN